ncbi:hypothetical protein V6Z12_A13G265800 [Gossypium hirsutum]
MSFGGQFEIYFVGIFNIFLSCNGQIMMSLLNLHRSSMVSLESELVVDTQTVALHQLPNMFLF